MSTNLDCEYCKKTFSSISNLNLHKKTANYCIKLREEIEDNKNNNLLCSFCNKESTTKTNLSIHLKTCKEKQFKIKLDNELEKLKIDYEEKLNKQKIDYEEKLNKQKIDYEEKLIKQKDEYEKKIISIGSEMGAKEIILKEEIMDLNRYNSNVEAELKYRKEEIKNLQITINELKTTINKYMENDAKRVDKTCNVSQPTKINTINNNISIYIKPLDTSIERFNTIVTNVYDYNMYKKGVKGTIELLTSFFKQDGKIQAYCSDINRGYIKTIDPDFSEKLHTLSSLFEMYKTSTPLKNKKVDYYEQMLKELKEKLNDDILACEQSLNHSADSFSEEQFKESYNKLKEKFYNIYKKLSQQNVQDIELLLEQNDANTENVLAVRNDNVNTEPSSLPLRGDGSPIRDSERFARDSTTENVPPIGGNILGILNLQEINEAQLDFLNSQ
jgi:hypothetical protein